MTDAVAERVRKERVSQGKPETIRDESTLRRVALLVAQTKGDILKWNSSAYGSLK